MPDESEGALLHPLGNKIALKEKIISDAGHKL